MSVKVSKVRKIQSTTKTYLKFDWECTECGATTTSEVLESILFQYKKRSLAPMTTKKSCGKCSTKHSMELKL